MTAAVASASGPTNTTATATPATAVAEGAGSGLVGVPGQVKRPYLAPVPDSEPPFDDEMGAGHAVHGPRPVARTAEFPAVVFGTSSAPGSLDPGSGIRPGSAAPPVLTAAGSDGPTGAGRSAAVRAAAVPSWSAEADIGVVRTSTTQLPQVRRAAPVLARAVIEVLAGHRPAAQLRVHCTPAIYAGFGNRPAATARSLPHLLSVRVCEPADGVAEVSAVYRRADRVRALAFRLQGVDGRWRITALQLG